MKRFFLVALFMLGLFTVLAANPWVGEMKSTVNEQVGQISFDVSANPEVGDTFPGNYNYGGQSGTLAFNCGKITKIATQVIVISVYGEFHDVFGNFIYKGWATITITIPGSRMNAFQAIKSFTSQILNPNTGTGEWEAVDGSDKGIFNLRAQ